MKKINKPLAFIFLIIIISVCFIFLGRNLPTRSKLIPYLVASFLIILAIVQFSLEAIPDFGGKEIGKFKLFVHQPEIQREKIQTGKDGVIENNENKKYFYILRWILSLGLGIYFFGFLVILPIFVFLFYFIECHYKWNKALIVTVVFWIIIYLVFEKFLATELYRGIIMLAM